MIQLCLYIVLAVFTALRGVTLLRILYFYFSVPFDQDFARWCMFKLSYFRMRWLPLPLILLVTLRLESYTGAASGIGGRWRYADVNLFLDERANCAFKQRLIVKC